MGQRLFETKDGYKINVIASLIECLGGEVRDGNRHQKVFSFPGVDMIPCSLDESTSFKYQVANIIEKVSDYSKDQLCQALRKANKPNKIYRALASYT